MQQSISLVTKSVPVCAYDNAVARFRGGFAMRRMSHFIGAVFLAAVLIAPVVTTSCGTTTTSAPVVYDTAHGDNHKWDDHEETVYKGWLSDNHKEYRPIKEAPPEDQKSYWDWRHGHPEK
jgi:hypothetical protein